MRGSLIWMAALACFAARSDGGEPQARAGWFGVFPRGPVNYGLRYLPPVVAEGKDPTVYRQQVQYDWLGDDFRQAMATLARDPDFKTKYAADALKDQGAIEVVVGKKSGWLLPARGADLGLQRDLIVPLGEDTALIVTGVGHFGEQEMIRLAETFDPARAAEALAKPPRTTFTRDRETFAALPKGAGWFDIEDWAGYPDKTTVKDKRIEGADYALPDGASIRLSVKDGKLTGVTYSDRDGKSEELLK